MPYTFLFEKGYAWPLLDIDLFSILNKQNVCPQDITPSILTPSRLQCKPKISPGIRHRYILICGQFNTGLASLDTNSM
jgi:hypothetical protein